MPAPKAAKAAAYHHLGQTLRTLEADLRWGLDGSPRIPDAWHAIAQNPGPPAKVPVTIRIDADVARFFRSMGSGHLTRMNAVLRAFMLARLSGVLRGAEDVAYAPSVADEVEAVRREIAAVAGVTTEAMQAEVEAWEAERRAREELEGLRMLREERG